MPNLVEVRVPDLGGFKGVDVIEVLVKPGATVAVDDPLVMLSSDKASMDVPSTVAGVVQEVKVKAGGKVNEGDVVVVVESDASSPTTDDRPAAVPHTSTPARPHPAGLTATGEGEQSGAALPPADVTCDVLVLGAGPGGYTAAFRAADLGQKVVLVERFPIL